MAVIPAALTDHYAVELRITVNNTDLKRPRCRWKMDPMLITEEILTRKRNSEWVLWQKCKQLYPDITMWWKRYMKKRLQILLRKEQSDRNKDFKSDGKPSTLMHL
jgi:hypothetical protein